ncbi:deoxyribonuclease IV [Candidatus Bathyarchaeota archaeon]|nr:MAG: deoxyribonuclease IV [Candidatus Bathyarchaeota archaeon]
MKVGLHVSIAGTIDLAVDRAKESNCDTFQVFTRNPRGWRYSALDPQEVGNFKEKLKTSGIGPPISHMPYLPNLACPEDELYEKSVATLAEEVDRCVQLGIPYIVTHLGSHLGRGREVGLQRLTSALDVATKRARGDLQILLENMAGQANSMGSKFQDLKEIMSGVKRAERIGVCFDTCHAYAAGYDLQSKRGVDQTLSKFNDIIGFDSLKVVHLNDSKGGIGSGLDRHEHIGMGYIGERGFKAFLHHDTTRGLPWVLETPEDERRDAQGNLRMVRKLGK